MCVQGVISSYGALEGLGLPCLGYRLVLRLSAAGGFVTSNDTYPSGCSD